REKTRVRLVGLEPKGHETSPPARYTEASLIKELERIGVGRPSTYAATIGTIERRGYVFRQGKALVPSFTAFAVTRLLREHFGDLIDVAFTAEMEEDLDQISRGEREWLDFIRQFYHGDAGRSVEAARAAARARPAFGIGAADCRGPRPFRSLREARRRLSVARSHGRSLHRRPRPRRRAVQCTEAIPTSGDQARHPDDRGTGRRNGAAGARWPVRPVRDGRRAERVDPQGDRSRDAFARRC